MAELNMKKKKNYTPKGLVGVKNKYRIKFSLAFLGPPELILEIVNRLQTIYPEIYEIHFHEMGIEGPPVPMSSLPPIAFDYKSPYNKGVKVVTGLNVTKEIV
jgi:hypothetical protein